MPADRPGLTTRAAVLGLVVCGLVVSAALPLREYLSQHSQIAAARARNAAQQARVDALSKQLVRWDDPAYVKAQARTRLHFVMPGEIAYVVLGAPPTDAVPGLAAVPTTKPLSRSAPWYSQVWGSVEVADHSAGSPHPTPTRSATRR